MDRFWKCPGCAGMYDNKDEVERCLASDCAKDLDGLPLFNGEGDPDNTTTED